MVKVYKKSEKEFNIKIDGEIVFETNDALMSSNDVITALGLGRFGKVQVFPVDFLSENQAEYVAPSPTGSGKQSLDEAINQYNEDLDKPKAKSNLSDYRNTLDDEFEDEDDDFEEDEFDTDEEDLDEQNDGNDDRPGSVDVITEGSLVYIDNISPSTPNAPSVLGGVVVVESIATLAGITMFTVESIPGVIFNWDVLCEEQESLGVEFGYTPARMVR